MKNIATANDELTSVKLLYTEKNLTHAIIANKSGLIQILRITKSFLGNYSYMVNTLYEDTFRFVRSIAVQRPKNGKAYFSEFCNKSCLTAIGGQNQVSILSLKPFPAKELKTIENPAVCENNLEPNFSWGYGLTPSNKSKTMPLLAIAWDHIIQLVRVEENDVNSRPRLLFDGYYCSDKIINQVYFMADSILVILVGATEFKVINTELFKEGDVSIFAKSKRHGVDIVEGRSFKEAIKETRQSELERGHLNRDIKKYNLDADMTSVNFNNTMV